MEGPGQFEHQLRARQPLRLVSPAVIAVIVLILYLTYRSVVDTVLMMTSVLGALAGGAIFQWLFGFNFSVAVQVGYIACFGMAGGTGGGLLVLLPEAIAGGGGVGGIGADAPMRPGGPAGAAPPPRAQALSP